jgi:Domain of unknown function (DUF4349)
MPTVNEETTTILIDTALAAGSATALDPEERKLQELVLELRDDAPAPDPDFELRMNARVAAGFPSSRRGLRMPAFALRRPQLAALGVAASLLVALVVAVSIDNGGSQSAGVAATSGARDAAGGGSAAVPESAAAPTQKAIAPAPSASTESGAPSSSAGSTADSVIGPVPPSPGGGFVGGRNRKVERSAALTLATPKDKLSDVGDQVIAVTDRYRGFVLSSSVTSAGDEGSNGSFDLRIPVRSLRPALRDLSGLADVKSRTENANDVTASFVSARTRLQELNAERRGLLRRLENAPTDRAASAIRARIRIVNAQIESQTQVMNDLRRRTNYAAVSVTLQAKQGDSGGGGGISDGARDLRDSLVDAANLSLRVLGVAIPIALVIALLWAGSGWFTRRRRESALDSWT